MRLSPELRAALHTIGNASIGIGLGMSVLVIAVVLSQFAVGQVSITLSLPAAPDAASIHALAATPAPTTPTHTTAPATAAPRATPADASTPAPTQSATPDPVNVTAYTHSGRRYAALRAPVNHIYVAPIAGTVKVLMYQLIDGEVRVGSSIPSLPFFPYVTLESADRRVIFRPGLLNDDAQLLVKDGERAEPGTPLFKIVGEGASSWRTFYDRTVTANIVVSVAALPSGAEVDPVAFFTTR